MEFERARKFIRNEAKYITLFGAYFLGGGLFSYSYASFLENQRSSRNFTDISSLYPEQTVEIMDHSIDLFRVENFQWVPFPRQQVQELLLICAMDGQDLQLRSSRSQNTLTINGESHNLRIYAVVAGNPQTGKSALQSYGTPEGFQEISENERIIQYIPISSRNIYNPGSGVRVIIIKVSEYLAKSKEELKRMIPQRCYTSLFANA